MPTNKFPAQAEMIERVKAILNLSDEALAAEVDVRPETLQKYAAGYQKAGGKLMQIIARLPEMRRRAAEAPAGFAATGEGGSPGDPPSAQEQLGSVLKEGTLDEVRLIKQVIGTLFRQITARRQPLLPAVRTRQPALFEGRPRLLPALGYVPAGWPQGGVEQIADQFIAVPADEFPEAEFALRVHGDSMVDVDIHHGDWVLLDSRRAPRDGNVVAALCDNETTLKTWLSDGERGPVLRSENRAYPARIIAREEMQVQGVMVGKISMRSGNSADPAGAGSPF